MLVFFFFFFFFFFQCDFACSKIAPEGVKPRAAPYAKAGVGLGPSWGPYRKEPLRRDRTSLLSYSCSLICSSSSSYLCPRFNRRFGFFGYFFDRFFDAGCSFGLIFWHLNHSFVRPFAHFHKFSENCSNLTKIVHFFKKMPKFFQFCPNHLTCSAFIFFILAHFASFYVTLLALRFAKISLRGFILLHLASFGLIWLHLASFGFIWLHLASFGLHLASFGLLLAEPRAHQIATRHCFKIGPEHQPRIADRRITAWAFPCFSKT